MTAAIAPPFDSILPAPFGALGLRVDDAALSEICFLPPGTPALPGTHPLAIEAEHQFRAYLASPQHRFDLPLRTAGTDFQQRVWAEIATIAPGELRAYGQLAARLGSAARAVGQACGANPFPVVVPCHRVVAQHALGGFAHAREGFLIDTKQWLIQHEQRR
ncbi:methylated-DNA--[protein]-cysteine S-methyltransferase [Denitromonas ohlonensis]|uniref:Methylated-DNA--[protein]-cysteine S-methyltransferase n=2 Tax=Denitromonas TaxID=139331 RepID=A0A557SND4_9RHOO|nr:methylated-DNA--[protein]-cysteine S-methyltransferase [Denitromonas ohlonensis]TVO62730.1 methylated-DNA--[protein]-cysteine S-methyltransferase [Denitromonas ohlonensis]TVO78935.1 methylated-DNA--[protein]-cysteine S-methyltransferase [Denitromonas ohlonensis]TVT75094.1 MAG: methylated-DNA--[protein]-cysteine S-methyltransferase [Denitromonas halophila]